MEPTSKIASWSPADALPLPRTQPRADAVAQRRGRRGGRGLRRAGEEVAHLRVLVARLRAHRLQPLVVLAAEEIVAQLRVHGGEKLRQVDTARGEIERKVPRLGTAAAQHGGACVVEGVVRRVVVLLPAGRAQDAAAADALGGAVEDDGGILRRGRRGAAEKAVIEVAEGRALRRLRRLRGKRGNRRFFGARRLLFARRRLQQALRQQQKERRADGALPQQEERIVRVEERRQARKRRAQRKCHLPAAPPAARGKAATPHRRAP